MNNLLWIEPCGVTCYDLRTSKLSTRKRCVYPRSSVILSSLLNKTGLNKVQSIAQKLGETDYILDTEMCIEVKIIDRIGLGIHKEIINRHDSKGYVGPINYYEPIEYGLTDDGLEVILSGIDDVAIVAIPAKFTSSRDAVLRTAKIAKQHFPKSFIIIGGAYVTADCNFFTISQYIDIICIGESWLSFPIVVNSLITGKPITNIKGIIYKSSDGSIINNSKSLGFYKKILSLDDLPLPDWDLLSFNSYDKYGIEQIAHINSGDRVGAIDTEMGCGKKPPCGFCFSGCYYKDHVSIKSSQRIIIEILSLVDNYNRNIIHFASDNPLIDNSRAVDIFTWLDEYNSNRKLKKLEPVQFCFPNGVAAWTLNGNNRLINKMIAAGMQHIALALETASPKLTKFIGKPRNIKDYVENSIRIIRECESKYPRNDKNQVTIEVFIQLGLPSETYLDVFETLNFCTYISNKYSVIISPLYYTPLHGTYLFDLFFNENPKAQYLDWKILGLMGTEKLDNSDHNALNSKIRDSIYELNINKASIYLDTKSMNFVGRI